MDVELIIKASRLLWRRRIVAGCGEGRRRKSRRNQINAVDRLRPRIENQAGRVQLAATLVSPSTTDFRSDWLDLDCNIATTPSPLSRSQSHSGHWPPAAPRALQRTPEVTSKRTDDHGFPQIGRRISHRQGQLVPLFARRPRGYRRLDLDAAQRYETGTVVPTRVATEI